MIYTEANIGTLYRASLAEARRALARLAIAGGREPSFQGLNGWVFEQAIRSYLQDELQARGVTLQVKEQVSLGGRTKVDLTVGQAAIEIKAGGIFGDEFEKYRRYRQRAEASHLTYFYLTLQETHQPFRKAMLAAFGDANAFFLDDPGSWKAFVGAIAEANAA